MEARDLVTRSRSCLPVRPLPGGSVSCWHPVLWKQTPRPAHTQAEENQLLPRERTSANTVWNSSARDTCLFPRMSASETRTRETKKTEAETMLSPGFHPQAHVKMHRAIGVASPLFSHRADVPLPALSPNLGKTTHQPTLRTFLCCFLRPVAEENPPEARVPHTGDTPTKHVLVCYVLPCAACWDSAGSPEWVPASTAPVEYRTSASVCSTGSLVLNSREAQPCGSGD